MIVLSKIIGIRHASSDILHEPVWFTVQLVISMSVQFTTIT